MLAILSEFGPMRASYIGERLWEEKSKKRTYLPQRFARAAGKVLRAMERRKLVQQGKDLKWKL